MNWQQKMCYVAEEKVRVAALGLSQCENELAQLRAASVATESALMQSSLLTAVDLRAMSEFRNMVARSERTIIRRLHESSEILASEKRALQAERHRLRMLEKLRERDLQDFTIEEERALEAVSMEGFLSKWVSKAQTINVL